MYGTMFKYGTVAGTILFPTTNKTNGFSVKQVGKQHTDHLLNTLQQSYAVSEDWDSALYCGILLKWKYRKRNISIAEYLHKQLKKISSSKTKILPGFPN